MNIFVGGKFRSEHFRLIHRRLYPSSLNPSSLAFLRFSAKTRVAPELLNALRMMRLFAVYRVCCCFHVRKRRGAGPAPAPSQQAPVAPEGVRQSAVAFVAPAGSRASRTARRSQWLGVRRRSRRSLLAESIPCHRTVHDASLAVSGDSGTGRAGGRTKRSGDRRPVPRSVRFAPRSCGCRQFREEPHGRSCRTSGARVWRSAAGRARQLAEYGAIVRRHSRSVSSQENSASMDSRRRS